MFEEAKKFIELMYEECGLTKKNARLSEIEAEISEIENQIGKLTEEMSLPENASDIQKSGKSADKIKYLEEQNQQLYKEWEKLISD